MTEPNPDLDARLARLAARKAAGTGAKRDRATTDASTNAATPVETSNVTSLPAPPSDDITPSATAPPKRARRRHPAAAGRILSVGLSSSAFLSMIAAFGSQTSGASTAASSNTTPVTRPAPKPKIVIKDVHHTIYVDQWVAQTPAPAVPKGLTALPASTQPPAGSGPKQSNGGGTKGGSAAGAPSWPSSPSMNAPGGGNGGGAAAGPSPGNPAPAPSPSQPSPGPAPTTPHVTPGPTAPPVTSPPATVVTTPPPPPPPPCSGTKCP